MSEPGEKWVTSLKNEFLECPVCVEHFNQTDKSPRLLKTCLHAFCSQCIDQLLEKEGRGQLTCPMCRHVEKVKGTAKCLPADPVRSKLVDFLHMKRQKKIKCTDCPDGNDADGRCDTCQMYLCKECINAHKRHHFSRDHHITSIEEALQVPIREFSQGHFCPKHPKQHIDFYCTTDEELCCVSCTVIDHKGHEFEKIQDAAAKRTSSLLESLQDVNKTKTGLQQRQKALKAKKNAVEQMNKDSERNINKMIDNMKLQLDQRRNQLLYELQQESSAMLSAIEKSSAAYDTTLAIIESTDTYFAQAKEKADDVEMLQMYPAIKRSVDALQSQPVTADLKINEDKVKFSPTQKTAFDGLVSQLGTFGRQDSPRQAVQHIPDVETVLKKKDQLTMDNKMLMSVYFENIGPVQEKCELIIEAEVDLTVGQCRLLVATGKLDEMKNQVDIELKDERRIVMKGKQKALADMREVIQDFKRQVKETTVYCSEAKQKYLLDDACEKLMIRRMRKKNIEGVWYLSHHQLKVCATSEGDLQNIAKWIDRHLKEKIFDVSREEYGQVMETMRKMDVGSYLLEYDRFGHKLHFVSQHEESYDACEIVREIVDRKKNENHLKDEAMAKRKQEERSRKPIQKSIKEIVTQNQKLFLQRFKREDIKALETTCGVRIIFEGPENIVEISGPENKETLQRFRTIVGDVKMVILPLSPESSMQILTSGYLESLEKYVGDTERCVISHKIQPVANESGDEPLEGAVGGATGGYNPEEKGSRSSYPEHGSPQTRRSRKGRSFCAKEIKIVVKEGEIAKEKSDIIVNTVSKGFDMKAGAISKSLLSAGGWLFEKECGDKIFKLHEGSYVVTGGGNLNCTHVFHCCLYPPSSLIAGESIEGLMSQMLTYADSLKSKTISLPALGTGGFGYSPDLVANLMFKSVTEYSKRKPTSSIEEVRIVIYHNSTAFKAFTDVQTEGSHQSDGGKHNQGGKKVIAEVKVGEIAKEKVDVIVNTSNSTLQLDAGAVSKSLLIQAGDKLQKECTKAMKDKLFLLVWEFIHTPAGNLDCKRVYHCYMPSYPGSYTGIYSISKLKEMVFNMLENAHKHKKNESIAFPALGTGNLGYPRDQVAKAMFEGVKEFKDKYPSSNLKDIRFVIYQKDEKSIQAFKEAERVVTGGRVEEFKKPWSATSSSSPVAPPREKELRVSSIPVMVKQGDLSQEQLEAVVNPIDISGSFKGNVHKALLKVGGAEFDENTKTKGEKLRRNGIASVPLNNDVVVFHIDRNIVRRDQRQAIVECLEYADFRDYKTIGFPIMQTGDAAEGMARDMFDAIYQFYNQRKKPIIIEQIFVVIYQMDQFHKFHECLKRKCDSQPMTVGKTQNEDKGRITFTIVSDEQPLLLRAKKVLTEFCSDRDVVGVLPLPPSISNKNIKAIVLQHDNVNISDISKHDKKILELKGKPHDVLKVIKDFHEHFKKEFEDWESDDSRDAEQYSEENRDVNPLNTWNFSKETFFKNRSWSGQNTSSDTQEKAERFSRNDDFQTNSLGNGAKTSSINFQGYKMADIDEGSYKSGSLGTDDQEETSPRKRMPPYKMRWYYNDPEDDELKEYEDDVSRNIEESYVHGRQKHQLPMDDNFEQYVVDFGTMEEYPEKNQDDSVMVVRREVVREDPDFPMKDEQLKVQMITTSDKEYDNILGTIKDSLGKTKVSVLKIEQIQNVKIHQRFEEKKLTMDVREKKLWFRCTKRDMIFPINKWGISVTFTKDEHCSSLGEGMEFAASFTDMVQRDNNENQYAYLCKVLVGDYTEGESGLRDPPRREVDESSYVHSVVDRVDRPSKYLVFSDAQIEPQYLVTFKVQT